ncbi:hypothetical protein [Flavobacterium sp. N3904]|uniref:hypothetical protein n=1 Tax=Flavobacterium sp. N3904 TaxID=2986835 RepID=UPI0022243645|nr:hypothetical protein [Flavobacterium sp. N3904]
MKKIALVLLVIIGITACSSDDGYNYHYETLPVATYQVPDTFELGKTYEIKMKYLRPSTCYKYTGIYFDKDFSTRTIAIDNLIVEDPTCKTLVSDSIAVSFNFLVVNKEPYTFKFYKGEDADGKNIFDEVVIPVK